MYRADLSEGTETVNGRPQPVRFVGWLDEEHRFSTGPTPDSFRTTLFELCRNPVNLTMGFHECPFCEKQTGGTKGAQTVSGVATGSGEIHVPAPDGTVYVAPDLIAHFVAVHHYRPPDPFIAAVGGEEHSQPQHRRKWDRLKLGAYASAALAMFVAVWISLMLAMQDAQQLAREGQPATAIVVAEARTEGRRWLAAQVLRRFKQDISILGQPASLIVSEAMPIGTIVPVLYLPDRPRVVVIGQRGDSALVLYQRNTGLAYTALSIFAALVGLIYGIKWLIAGLSRTE